MQQANPDTNIWVRFFKDATIPVQYVQSYAQKFTENRIRFDMLSDLDRPLLNEMGITAIGDCLSILKHAKIINSQIEEKNKADLGSSGTTATATIVSSETNAKKRSDVAKRIIETYLSDPDAKPLNEKSNSNPSSSLSADLISRLNFNPLTTNKLSLQNTDDSSSSSSSPKVIVSSTTSDDELRNKLKNKRKLDEVFEANSSDSKTHLKIVKTITQSIKQGPELEYRGLLKNELACETSDSKLSNFKSKKATTAPLSMNERLKLNKPKLKKSSGFEYEDFQIETKNEAVTPKASLSVSTDSLNNKSLMSNRFKLSNNSLRSDSISNTTAPIQARTNSIVKKPKIIPITFDTKPTNSSAQQKTSTTASVMSKVVTNLSQSRIKPPVGSNNVFSRISF